MMAHLVMHTFLFQRSNVATISASGPPTMCVILALSATRPWCQHLYGSNVDCYAAAMVDA